MSVRAGALPGPFNRFRRIFTQTFLIGRPLERYSRSLNKYTPLAYSVLSPVYPTRISAKAIHGLIVSRSESITRYCLCITKRLEINVNTLSSVLVATDAVLPHDERLSTIIDVAENKSSSNSQVNALYAYPSAKAADLMVFFENLIGPIMRSAILPPGELSAIQVILLLEILDAFFIVSHFKDCLVDFIVRMCSS